MTTITRPTDAEIEAAHAVLAQDYHAEIIDGRDEVRRLVVEEGMEQGDAVHEYVDGLARVIYTGQAISALRYCESGSENAYIEEIGEVPLDESGDIHWSGLAYMAIKADIEARL